MFSHLYIEISLAIIFFKWGLNSLFILPKSKHFYFVLNCLAENLLKLISKKFRMVCKVDGNLQLDLRDWSMYSRILK